VIVRSVLPQQRQREIAFLSLLASLARGRTRFALILDERRCPAVVVENLPGHISSGWGFLLAEDGRRYVERINRCIGLSAEAISRILASARREWTEEGG
jgi:hypothetical protein